VGVLSEENGNSSVNTLLETAASIVMGHHEKWDGSGYQRGLSGHAIPIECRIIALADEKLPAS
jgi:putative two-component system response regulator